MLEDVGEAQVVEFNPQRLAAPDVAGGAGRRTSEVVQREIDAVEDDLVRRFSEEDLINAEVPFPGRATRISEEEMRPLNALFDERDALIAGERSGDLNAAFARLSNDVFDGPATQDDIRAVLQQLEESHFLHTATGNVVTRSQDELADTLFNRLSSSVFRREGSRGEVPEAIIGQTRAEARRMWEGGSLGRSPERIIRQSEQLAQEILTPPQAALPQAPVRQIAPATPDVTGGGRRGFAVEREFTTGSGDRINVVNEGAEAQLILGPADESGRLGSIVDLETKADVRRQGFARDLVQDSIDELQRRGATRIEIFSERGGSRGLFEQLGFTETGTRNRLGDREMVLDLTGRSPSPAAPTTPPVRAAREAAGAGQTPIDRLARFPEGGVQNVVPTRSGRFKILDITDPEAQLAAQEESLEDGILGPVIRMQVWTDDGQPLAAIAARRMPTGGDAFEIEVRGLDLAGNPLPFEDKAFANSFSRPELFEIAEAVADLTGARTLVGFRVGTGEIRDITLDQIRNVLGRASPATPGVRAADEVVPPVTQAAAPPPPVEPPPGQVPPAAAPEPSGIPEVDFIAASVDDLSRVVGRPDLPADKDPLTLAAAKVIREAKPLTEKAKRALAKLNKQKAARAGASARRAPSNLERGAAFARGLGGEVEGKTFEGIRPLFSDEQLESLLTRIWGENSPLRTGGQASDFYNFDQFNADKAFQKLFNPDHTVIPAPFEIALLEKAFGTEFVRAILSKRSLGQKAWDLFVDVWNLPRATLASFDISATLRQAAALGPGNKRVFRDAFVSQLKAFAKESYAVAARERMRANLNFERFTRKPGGGTRLQITDFAESTTLSNREEAFISRLTGKLWGFRNSARGYTTMLNELRFGVMENMVKNIEKAGLEATDDQLDAIANYINWSSGRGPLGPAEAALPILNGLFFSIRLTTSRFALPAAALTRAPGVRAKVIADLVSFALTFGSLLALAEAAPGVDVNRNGKIKIGKAELDLGAGFLQPLRLIRSLITGKKTSTSTGTTSDVDRGREVLVGLRSKAHPTLGFGIDAITQKDFIGDEFTVTDPKVYRQLNTRTNPALRLLTPLIAQDIEEAVRVGSAPEIVAATFGGTFGAGVQTFDSVGTMAEEVYRKPYSKLWLFEKDIVRMLFRAVDDGEPSELEKINDQHLADLNAVLADKTLSRSEKVREYFSLETLYAGIRQGTSQQIFGDATYETVQGGTDKEQAALQEYYDAQAAMKPESLEPSVPSGRFNTELWAVTIEELEKKWFREGTLDYVSANTNRRLIPEGLFNILPKKTKDRIQRSSDARAERELQNPPRSDYSGAIQSGTEAATAPGQQAVPQQPAAPRKLIEYPGY